MSSCWFLVGPAPPLCLCLGCIGLRSDYGCRSSSPAMPSPVRSTAQCDRGVSDYLLAEVERLAARPTRDEMLATLHGRRRVTLKTPAAIVIRDEHESAYSSSMRRGSCESGTGTPR